MIAPDPRLQNGDDLVARMTLPLFSGHKAAPGWWQYCGIQPGFDQIIERNRGFEHAHEDLCWARYYFDRYGAREAMRGQFNRVAKVGVFLGGTSAVTSGHSEDRDFDLDLIDVNPTFLRFTYERIRRTHSVAAPRLRQFCPNTPSRP